MTDVQGVAAILTAIAWPAAFVIAVGLVRTELVGLFQRVDSLVFPGGRVTFATLANVEGVVAAAAKDAVSADEKEIVGYEATEFSVVEALTSASPAQAVIDAWGLLEYQLNVASDRLAPDQPHGWPQVVHNLEAWDKWPLLKPAVLELRRLRDYTVRSNRTPSSTDAARYVSVAEDVASTIRTSLVSPPGDVPGGGQ